MPWAKTETHNYALKTEQIKLKQMWVYLYTMKNDVSVE